MSTTAAKGIAASSYLLPEAEQLFSLIVDGGEQMRLGYNVSRTYAMRDANTRKPLFFSEVLAEDGFRPARERDEGGEETDRRFNAYVLRQHLLGHCDVAPEVPSWSSRWTWDIDRHLPSELKRKLRKGHLVTQCELDIIERANAQRDATLAELWRKAGWCKDRQPVIQQSPGGGYHVDVPFRRPTGSEAPWLNDAVRDLVEHWLDMRGIELRAGKLELFPCGNRLRAPCGKGMLLLQAERPDEPDDLGLVPVPGTWRGHHDHHSGLWVETRRIGAMVRAYCEAIEAARRPLGEWLQAEDPDRLWDEVRGPYGYRTQHAAKKIRIGPDRENLADHTYVDSPGYPPGPGFSDCPSGLLDPGGADLSPDAKGSLGESESSLICRGIKWKRKIVGYTANGLTEVNTRHDAVLALVFQWGAIEALREHEVDQRLEAWCRGHQHQSNDLEELGLEGFVKLCLREGRHYYRSTAGPAARAWLGRRSAGFSSVALAPVADADRALVARTVRADLRPSVLAILGYLKAHADKTDRVPLPVNMGQKTMTDIVGTKRLAVENRPPRQLHVLAIEELERLGLVTLYRRHSKGRHPRQYCCWYQFGRGALPHRNDDGALVLAERDVSEGRLQLLLEETGQRAVLLPHEGAAGIPRWVTRRLERRLFTLAEFDADWRRLFDGPFRQRFELEPDKRCQPESGDRVRGQVVEWGDAKGYGFIESSEGKVFVHQSEIRSKEFRSLRPGQLVEYTLRARDHGAKHGKPGAPYAIWVELLPEETASESEVLCPATADEPEIAVRLVDRARLDAANATIFAVDGPRSSPADQRSPLNRQMERTQRAWEAAQQGNVHGHVHSETREANVQRHVHSASRDPPLE